MCIIPAPLFNIQNRSHLFIRHAPALQNSRSLSTPTAIAKLAAVRCVQICGSKLAAVDCDLFCHRDTVQRLNRARAEFEANHRLS